jgi:DNA-directed RNA polymerase omega subunit
MAGKKHSRVCDQEYPISGHQVFPCATGFGLQNIPNLFWRAFMTAKIGAKDKKVTGDSNTKQLPGIDSRFRLIMVAAQRSKQLHGGALPRIDADPEKNRNTSIALEEVKQGLVPFTTTQAVED